MTNILLCLSFGLFSQLSFSAPQNFVVTYNGVTGIPHNDPSKPVSSGRSYFTTETEDLGDGKTKLIVHLWHGELNSPVSLNLGVALNSGQATEMRMAFPIQELSNAVKDNPDSYYSRREFILDHKILTEEMQKVLPASLNYLKIEPGTALFVSGKWHTWAHSWGGIDRAGVFYLPGKSSAEKSSLPTNRRVHDLDIAYPISNLLAMKYNNGTHGLKIGGQIQSRFEKEGKYQVAIEDTPKILKALFELANNPEFAKNILGPDWTIEAEMRYMKKNASGNYIIDPATGLPIPDPMIDTYYDSMDSKGAASDLAFRYRWTEGNATGSWNFKPGMGYVSPDGVVNRLEFAVNTTDDKPETIAKFADSNDKMNPFRFIRDLAPGSKPSDFLIPSLRLVDTRYKFKAKSTSGLVVEISLDLVDAHSLRDSKHKAKFAQLEMDLDHPSTTRKNVADSASNSFSDFLNLFPGQDATLKSYLSRFDGKTTTFIDGDPVMHSLADLEASSPVNQKLKVDFDFTEKMIIALRDHAVGPNWLPAPQKASLAAVLLGHLSKSKSSKSVKALLKARSEKQKAGFQINELFKSINLQIQSFSCAKAQAG